MSGTLQLNSGQYELVRSAEACPLSGGGYADIRSGTQVTVYDSAGKAVALGRLGIAAPAANVGERTNRCYFALDVDGVPEGSAIYSVEVSHRGRVQFTRDQLRDVIDLTLGS